jgi:hypothetical protein
MHRPILKTIGTLLLTGALMLSPSGAQEIEPFVIVPDHPQGIPLAGCFRANQQLFGHNFSFCFTRPGSYSVRGGGVRCDGRMTWRGGREIRAEIHRVSCGGGVAWERATMYCRPAGQNFGPIGRLLIRSLRCTYDPTVRGQSRRTFTASRT